MNCEFYDLRKRMYVTLSVMQQSLTWCWERWPGLARAGWMEEPCLAQLSSTQQAPHQPWLSSRFSIRDSDFSETSPWMIWSQTTNIQTLGSKWTDPFNIFRLLFGAQMWSDWSTLINTLQAVFKRRLSNFCHWRRVDMCASVTIIQDSQEDSTFTTWCLKNLSSKVCTFHYYKRCNHVTGVL